MIQWDLMGAKCGFSGIYGILPTNGHVKPNHFPMGYGIPWGFDGIRSGSGWELLASSFLAQHTYIIYFMTMIFGCILVQYTYIIKLNNIYIFILYMLYSYTQLLLSPEIQHHPCPLSGWSTEGQPSKRPGRIRSSEMWRTGCSLWR